MTARCGHDLPACLQAAQLRAEDSGESTTAGRELEEQQLGRLPEFAAAHILYFSCVVPKPEAFEVTHTRALTHM